MFTLKKVFTAAINPWLSLEMGGHDDHIVPHGFPGASEEVPQNPEGMEEVIGDVDEVSEGLASDVDSDSDSSVDSISSAATTIYEDDSESATRFNVNQNDTPTYNKSIQSEKISATNKGKQRSVSSGSSTSSFSPSVTSHSSPATSFASSHTPDSREFNGLGVNGLTKAHVADTSRASPEPQPSSSQVALSMLSPTPLEQPLAAQERRDARDAHMSFEAQPHPLEQVNPAVQDVVGAHDAHGLPRGSASPMGQDTNLVPAVQELATPHGEEPKLDGWDAQVSDPIAPQTQGTGRGKNARDRARHTEATISMCHRYFLSKFHRNYRMLRSWSLLLEPKMRAIMDPDEHLEEFLELYRAWVKEHSDAPDVHLDPDSFELPIEITDFIDDFDPEDYAFNSPDVEPPRTQEEFCNSLPYLGIRTRDFAFAPVPCTTETAETPVEIPVAEAKAIFDAVAALRAFDFVKKQVRLGNFLPIARFLCPDDLFRLVSIEWVTIDDLDWADARANYHIGKVREAESPGRWLSPKGRRHIPSAEQREVNVIGFIRGWKGFHSIVGEPFVGNPIAWIDGHGEECDEPPFPIDEETHQSFFDNFFMDSEPLMTSSGHLTVESPTAQKRTREDVDDDDDAPSAGPSSVPLTSSPSKKQKIDDDTRPLTRQPQNESAVAGPSTLPSTPVEIATPPSTPGSSRKRSQEETDFDTDDESDSPSPSKRARSTIDMTKATPRLTFGNANALAFSSSSSSPPSTTDDHQEIDFEIAEAPQVPLVDAPLPPPPPPPHVIEQDVIPLPGGGIDAEIAVAPQVEAPIIDAPLPPLQPPNLHNMGQGIVPLPRRGLRRHETTLWNGEVISRGFGLDRQPYI